MDYMEFFEDDDDFINDDIEVLEIIEYGFPRKFYRRPNFYEEMDDLNFFKRFRLYKETILFILEQVEHELEYPDDRNNSVSPINQLLCGLRYFASSGHLRQVADFMGMDESTASRIIARVSRVIARLFPRFVKMPEQQEWVREQNKFYNMARFPRVIGLIDGTHVKIQSPGGLNAEIYRNRKSYFSVNVQTVTDANLKFLDVVARWPGSAHDATIFGNSSIRARFEAGHYPECLLIGDSGYPLKNYLMSPLANPVTRGEQRYNEALIRTRNAIERQNGLWKRRFPVVAYGLRLSMETVKAIIVATTVLHNVARIMNEPEPPLPGDINEEELNYLIETQNINVQAENPIAANHIQNELIRYFGAL